MYEQLVHLDTLLFDTYWYTFILHTKCTRNIDTYSLFVYTSVYIFTICVYIYITCTLSEHVCYVNVYQYVYTFIWCMISSQHRTHYSHLHTPTSALTYILQLLTAHSTLTYILRLLSSYRKLSSHLHTPTAITIPQTVSFQDHQLYEKNHLDTLCACRWECTVECQWVCIPRLVSF